MNYTIKEMQEDKYKMQSQIEELVNVFANKYSVLDVEVSLVGGHIIGIKSYNTIIDVRY